MNNQFLRRSTAILFIIEGLLMFVPVIVLGAAINWPASLDQPASVVLPLIVQQRGAVIGGYSAYLLYSLLIWPVAALLGIMISKQDILSPLTRLAVGFGLASAVLRTLGIIRWLFPMPVLANLYIDPATSSQSKEVIVIIYQMLNAYAGSIGEVLGVGLFAALWVGLASIEIVHSKALPSWLGIFGIVAALALATGVLPIFGIDPGLFMTVSVTILQLWFLACGVVLLVRKPAPAVSLA